MEAFAVLFMDQNVALLSRPDVQFVRFVKQVWRPEADEEEFLSSEVLFDMPVRLTAVKFVILPVMSREELNTAAAVET